MGDLKKQSQFAGGQIGVIVLFERILWQYNHLRPAKKQSQNAGLRPEIRSSKHEVRNGADYVKACFTRSGVMGIWRSLAPVAS